MACQEALVQWDLEVTQERMELLVPLDAQEPLGQRVTEDHRVHLEQEDSKGCQDKGENQGSQARTAVLAFRVNLV